jgi:hypothetical protein
MPGGNRDHGLGGLRASNIFRAKSRKMRRDLDSPNSLQMSQVFHSLLRSRLGEQFEKSRLRDETRG